jgi:hypothetical protein
MDSTHSVMYMHFADNSSTSGEDTAKTYMDSLSQQLAGIGAGEPKTGDWDGDGLSGSYTAFDIGGGAGMVAFAVNDSPVTGVLMNLDIGGDGDINDLIAYFEDHVKPGADGGA